MTLVADVGQFLTVTWLEVGLGKYFGGPILVCPVYLLLRAPLIGARCLFRDWVVGPGPGITSLRGSPVSP